MFRKFILYLTGFCFALLLLSFSGCQSEQADTYSSVSIEESSAWALSQETPALPVSGTELSSLDETENTLEETTFEEAVTEETSGEEIPSQTTTLPEIDAETLINCSTTLYTYDQMEADLHTLTAAYPSILQMTTISNADGTEILTADGRPIYVAYFGNRNASQQIFICAATHAREYMTTQLVMRQLAHYCATYETGSYNGLSYREIFDRTCFVIVPMVNPDGVSISQLGLEGLHSEALQTQIQNIYNADMAAGYTSYDFATYLTRWKANANGVDLNRNYSPGWESVTDRLTPSADFFKGNTPGDQPEAQALMTVMNGLSNPRLALSYHSYGALVYWQYGQPEPLWSANEQLATAISDLTGYYLAGYSNEAGFSNWCVLEKGIPSVTVETGTVPTPLPLDQLEPLWQQNQDMWVMLGSVY
ncbi:MAG: hypothetical protein IJV50_02065 [Lachnospiraceae bacterium]|nr:hypothetical protein [Lachnospiraceae bacterium]